MVKWYLTACVVGLAALGATTPSIGAAVLSDESAVLIAGGCVRECVDPIGYCTSHCYISAECSGDGEMFCTQKRQKYNCKSTEANVLKPCIDEPNKPYYCGEIRTEGYCEHDLGWPDYCSGGDLVSDNCPGDYATGDPC